MIEAEVTCTCASITLPDLQLTLTQGATVYIDSVRAQHSKDLQRAWRASGVTIKYVQRYREQRPANATSTRPSVSPVLQGLPSTLVTPPAVDTEALAQRVAALLAPQIQAVLEAVQSLSFGVPSGRLVEGAAVPRSMGTVSEEVPVFIPSKIGRDDLQPTFEVQASAGTDNGGVSDALAALKAARKSEREAKRG